MVETPKGGALTSGESSFDPVVALDQVYTSQPMTQSFVHAPPEHKVRLGDYEKVFTDAKLGIELIEEERYFHGKLMKVAAVHSTRPGDTTMQLGDICSAVHGQGVLLTDEHSGESSFDRVIRLVQGHPSRPITLWFVHAPPVGGCVDRTYICLLAPLL